MKLTKTRIQDSNKDIITLSEYGARTVKIFLEDGDEVTTELLPNQKMEFPPIKEIREIHVNKIITHYVSDKEVTSVEQRDREYQELISKGVLDENDDLAWKDLDDEFAYRKFMQRWKPVYVDHYALSDPIPLIEGMIQFNTGNPYIKSIFTTVKSNSKDLYLYNYDRENACKDIIKSKFDSLGMQLCPDCDLQKTKTRKIWGKTTAKINFIKAFGTYPFSRDEFKYLYMTTDTLENCMDNYDRDKELIEGIIESEYRLLFTDFDENRLLSTALQSIQKVIKGLDEIHARPKSERKRLDLIKECRDIEGRIREQINETTKDT